MARRTAPIPLTPDQHVEADRLYAALVAATAADLRALAEQLATTTDRTIFGANEFVIRDLARGIAAKAIETALEERKKGGTTGRVAPARGAAKPPASSAGGRSRS